MHVYHNQYVSKSYYCIYIYVYDYFPSHIFCFNHHAKKLLGLSGSEVFARSSACRGWESLAWLLWQVQGAKVFMSIFDPKFNFMDSWAARCWTMSARVGKAKIIALIWDDSFKIKFLEWFANLHLHGKAVRGKRTARPLDTPSKTPGSTHHLALARREPSSRLKCGRGYSILLHEHISMHTYRIMYPHGFIVYGLYKVIHMSYMYIYMCVCTCIYICIYIYIIYIYLCMYGKIL